MAIHHVRHPEDLLAKLVDRLKPGGVVVAIDWALLEAGNTAQDQTSTNNPHPGAHTVVHSGFTKAQMDRMMQQAGCDEWEYIMPPEKTIVPPEIGGEKQLFFAKGRKATPLYHQ